MKIQSLLMAFAICSTMLASCSSQSKPDSDTTTPAETIVADDVVNLEDDSNGVSCEGDDAVVARGATTSEGFGRCSKCNCKEFEGRGQTCRNCGHAYKAHY